MHPTENPNPQLHPPQEMNNTINQTELFQLSMRHNVLMKQTSAGQVVQHLFQHSMPRRISYDAHVDVRLEQCRQATLPFPEQVNMPAQRCCTRGQKLQHKNQSVQSALYNPGMQHGSSFQS
jgi:hypothetical protein